MKRGTPEHPKMAHLCQHLKIKLYEATGILELIWHFAAKYTPHGDIGKYPDGSIAKAIGWNRAPDALMEALVVSGWLERSEEHRYILHDWPEHCEESVHMRLARSLEYFADGTQPHTARLPKSERERIEAHYVRTASARQAHGVSLLVRTASAPPLPKPKPEPMPLEGVDFDADSSFRELWESYPKKGRTKQVLAQQYYVEEVHSLEQHAVVMEAIGGKWSRSKKWRDGFILNLPEWIHNRSWEEDPEPADAEESYRSPYRTADEYDRMMERNRGQA